MTSPGQISDLREIKWNLYFWKAHDKRYPKIQFLSILDKYFKSYGNISAICPLFDMGSSKIWPYHVTQAKNLLFPYLKSYCPLNFRKSHQISWFCCIPNRSYKEDNLKEGRSCPPPPPPPPPPMWNRVNTSIANISWGIWMLLHVIITTQLSEDQRQRHTWKA